MAPGILAEIDEHATPGSSIHALIDTMSASAASIENFPVMRNHSISFAHGSMIDPSCVNLALAQGPFDHIMVLCPHDAMTQAQADARALLALLHVRNYLDQCPADASSTNLIAEVMRSEAVDLALVARPDDFIVSQRLVALVLAQLAEDPRREPILREILGASGAKVRLLTALSLGLVGEWAFRDILRCAGALGVIALGWKAAAYENHPQALRGGIRLNPSSSECVLLNDDDFVIVLAPDASQFGPHQGLVNSLHDHDTEG